MKCLAKVKETNKAQHPRRAGDYHVKRSGKLVVSLRGINKGFWSHLGCSG